MMPSTDEVLVWAISRHGRPDTLRRFQQKSYAMLATLQNQHELFRTLVICGKRDSSPFPKEWPNYEKIVEHHVRDEKHPTDYLNLTVDEQLKPESLSKIGFSLSFLSAEPETQQILPVERGGIELRLQGG